MHSGFPCYGKCKPCMKMCQGGATRYSTGWVRPRDDTENMGHRVHRVKCQVQVVGKQMEVTR